MDKKTFMRELRQALSVLQEDELNDIINEYEQHIDMKMKNGLTEDEAIADFGSLAELTADILEAYHVRADYAAGQKKEKNLYFGNGDRAAGKEIIQQAKKECKAAGKKVARGLHCFGLWLWGILMFWKKQLARPFIALKEMWKNRRDGDAARDMGDLGDMEDAAGIGNAIRRAFCLAAGCVRLGWKLALWAMRAAWNICCVALSLLCGGVGLCCLYILGLLVVLWMQHYPLAGVTIGCLGLVLCTFSAAGLCLTLLWRKKQKKTAGTDDPTDQSRKQSVGQENALMEKDESAVWYQEMEGGQHA